jgi:predicted SAM-dependent methyltransferase
MQKEVKLEMSIRRLLLRLRYYVSHHCMVKTYMKTHQTRKLQIGSGSNILNGWLNTDLKPNKQLIFLDATKNFSFNNETFDYIFSEHLIEHLKYEDGVNFLKECHRILKPKGKIRISTPDLQFLINLYRENPSELQKRYIVWAIKSFMPNIPIRTKTFVVNNFFRAWGHKFIYDFETLKQTLKNCGFTNITRCNIEKSKDQNFSGVESHGKYISSEFNKLESLVVEAETRA